MLRINQNEYGYYGIQLYGHFLKRLLGEKRIPVAMTETPSPVSSVYVMLEKHPFLTGLFLPLEQYFDAQQYPSLELMEAKLEEAVFTLLQLRPDLREVLFDFAEPWKMDLKEFMDKNYKCDLTLEEFAHYAGRSSLRKQPARPMP